MKSARLIPLLLAALLVAGCGTPEDEDGTRYTTPTNRPDPVCGNDRTESGEACDGTDLRGATCEQFGLGAGTLACLGDCSAYDRSGCGAPATCGNSTVDGSEVCDPSVGVSLPCSVAGLGDGQMSCLSNCAEWDTSTCGGASSCGNGTADAGEACDGADLRGLSCQALGLGDGELGCASDCSQIDNSDCDGGGGPVCGDGVRNGTEVCDGADFGGLTCVALGFTGGTLACDGCTAIDTGDCDGGCTGPSCNPTYEPELSLAYNGLTGPDAGDCVAGDCVIPQGDGLVFPTVTLGARSSATLTVRNFAACAGATSCSDCSLSIVAFEIFGTDAAAFSVELTAPTPWSVPRADATCGANGELNLPLGFTAPTTPGARQATLVLHSDDPARSSIELPLFGTAVSVPVALPEFRAFDSGNPTAPWTDPNDLSAQTRLYFDGRQSYDPRDSGNPALITGYQWSVTTYPGSVPPSTLDLAGAATPLFSFYAPTDGAYVVELVVTNESGQPSLPAKLSFTISSQPADDSLRVELTWADGQSDLDLHLVNSSLGTLLCDAGSDCYWNAKTPIWDSGSPAGQGANPSLDIDDTNGYGPELIRIDSPATGVYRVYVHYWGNQVTPTAPADATIAVSDAGQVLTSTHRQLPAPGAIWAVGDVLVTPLGTQFVPYASDASGEVGTIKTMTDAECSNGGFDFEVGSTSGCTSNAGCAAGLVCVQNACQPCSSSSQCDSGEACGPDGLCQTACTSSTQCGGGVCVGGVCTTAAGIACSSDAACSGMGSGATCLQPTEGFKNGYCSLEGCTSHTQCGAGGHCAFADATSGQGVCVRTCQSDLGCRADGYLCYDGEGDGNKECWPAATGTGAVGDPCTAIWQCGGGVSGYCVTDWPGGYCARDCGPTNICPEGAACITQLDFFGGGSFAFVCQEACTTDIECRSGYTCTTNPLDLFGRLSCQPSP